MGDDRARASARSIPDAAYIVYTSGSTGRPKGVVIGRDALGAYAEAMHERLGVTAEDSYLHTASFAFSSSVRQWVVPLVAGARIVVAGRPQLADARALLRFMRDEHVTVADLVPSYLRSCVQVLMDEDVGARRELLDNDLRLLVTASEPLPVSVVNAWRRDLGHPAKMINMFGQTETAGIVATYAIPDEIGESGIVPIGLPLPGVEVLALDEDGEPVAEGESGELVVIGPTLASGYVGLEEATNERFEDVETGPFAGSRMYRSGDVVRPRGPGVMDFLGRRDTQVKVRGHRVELEEIEARLGAHPDITEAAVVPNADSGETVLAAIVVAGADRELDPAAVRRYVGAALPDYMVPSVVLRADALPRTPNGKLDRSALPDVEAERLELSSAFVEPATDTERAVAALWVRATRRGRA